MRAVMYRTKTRVGRNNGRPYRSNERRSLGCCFLLRCPGGDRRVGRGRGPLA